MKWEECSCPPGRKVEGHGDRYCNYGYQYWRQLADGRLVIGGWRNTAFDVETGYDTNTTPAIQQAI